jgi:sorbin and SH3 domain containing protein 1
MEIVCSHKNHKTQPLNMGSVQQKKKTFVSYVPQPPNRKSSKCILKCDTLLPGLQMWHKKPSNHFYHRYSTSLDAQRMRSHLLSNVEEKYFMKNLELNNWSNRRATSSSPVRRPAISATDDTRIAFGRKISREFTFAEEKKRLEEEFSKIYKDVTVSTRILKNPDLKSNQQVKFALQNSLEPLTKTLICTRRNRNQSTAKLNGSNTSISNFYSNKSVHQGVVKMNKTNSQSYSNSTLSSDLLDLNTKIKRKNPSDKSEETQFNEKNQTNNKKENKNYLAQCSHEFFFEKSTEQLNSTNIKPVNAENNTEKFNVATKNKQINLRNFNSDYADTATYTFSETNKRRRQSRSPSIRRIQSIKQQLVIAQSKRKNLRSRSLSNSGFYCIQSQSSQMDRSFSLNSVSQTPDSFRFNNFQRFQELTNFYSSLERIAQLEKAISQTDLRRKNNNEMSDYNLRQRVRAYENAEQELKYLTNKLRDQQDKKNVFFQAQDADKIRWNEESDAGLRVRDKSVEDLKHFFAKKPYNYMTSHHIDVKSSLGRVNSIIDRADKMTKKYEIPNEENHLVNHGLSPKLLSTLSFTQKSKLIDQLNEIYTNYDTKRSPYSKNVNFNTFPLKKRSSSEPPRLVSSTSQSARKNNENSSDNIDKNKFNTSQLNTYTEENVKHNKKLLNDELKNIYLANQNHIKNKINYFEHINCSKYIPTTIYHAREYSSGEEDILPSQCKPSDITQYSSNPILSSSQSFSDIREIFGESKQYLPSFYCSEIKNHRNSNKSHFNKLSPIDSEDVSSNFDNLKSQLALPRTDVHLRRFQSDSELDNLFFSGSKSGHLTKCNPHKIESNVVDNIKQNHAPSPISRSPLRKKSIYMPHINVISKTASLKKEIGGKVKVAKHETVLGESIKKIKDKLKLQGFNVYGQMFASAPDIRMFKDISSYLSGHWIAHQYPKPEDNGKITNEIQNSKNQPVNYGRVPGPFSNQTSYLSQYCDWFSCNTDVLKIDSKKNMNDKFFHLKLEKSLKNHSTSDQTSIQFRDNIKGVFIFCA